MSKIENIAFSIEKSTQEENFDELFNYDVDINNPFSNEYHPATFQKSKGDVKQLSSQHNNDLGIDNEIEIRRKQKAPRVKLDEDLLLSPSGIPKLRSKTESFEFKGRGYELWLDDLFPKARFLDALHMVEKLGHKKRIYLMRMSWLNGNETCQSFIHDETVKDALNTFRERPKIETNYSESIIYTTKNLRDETQESNYETAIAEDNMRDANPNHDKSEDMNFFSRSNPNFKRTRYYSSSNPMLKISDEDLDDEMADGIRLPQTIQVSHQIDITNNKEDAFCFDDDEKAMAEIELRGKFTIPTIEIDGIN